MSPELRAQIERIDALLKDSPPLPVEACCHPDIFREIKQEKTMKIPGRALILSEQLYSTAEKAGVLPDNAIKSEFVDLGTGIEITILDTETGEEAVHVDRYDYGDIYGSHFRYQWLEGNYGCDCNRALFHSRALDRDDLDVPCNGGVNRFRVVAIVDNGNEIPADFVAMLNR